MKKNTKRIQSLKVKVIVYGGFKDGEIHLHTVDGVIYSTDEFRKDPSTKYYNHKGNDCGLKYEYAIALRRVSVSKYAGFVDSKRKLFNLFSFSPLQSVLVWMRGPFAAGEKNDKTVFCGGTKKEPKDKWDQEALYFKLPEGKKAIGDSIYEGIPEKVTCVRDGQSPIVKDFLNRALARQENYHDRLWAYGVLKQQFRHNVNKMAQHKMCAEAVNVIVQYDLKYHPLFDL